MYKLILHFTISLELLSINTQDNDRERIKLIQSGLFLCYNSSDVKRYKIPGKGEITEKLSIYSHFKKYENKFN